MTLHSEHAASPGIDVLDAVLGATPGSTLFDLRRLREKVHAATQGSYDALFDPEATELSLEERLWVAHYATHWAGATALAQHYGARLVEAGYAKPDELAVPGADKTTQHTAAIETLLDYTRTLTLRPIDGGQASLDVLVKSGRSTPAIVALGQLIAFVSYQLRADAGLRALNSLEFAS